MTEKVFTIDTQPGIQRDGTLFDKAFYNDGRWVRFQRGRPRKIGGYREITNELKGPSRGMWVNPQNGFNSVFSGHSDGLQVITIDDNGVGSGANDFVLSDFTANSDNLWQFDGYYDVGGGMSQILAHPGQNLGMIDSTANTPVLIGDVTGTTTSKLGVFQLSTTTVNGNATITLAATDIRVGAGQTVTGAGIPANTTVVSVSTTSVVLSNNATASATVTVTFDNNISVSGGVVSLHPYIFVYGNDGLIKNNSAGNPNDWVSSDANETNVATGKIVQGLPVRGGSNSPSGLFWSLDSLIRVSFVGGSGTPPQFWRYDLISSQSSILSSQSVIEYDGVYYWCGVDRFLMYNGVVREVPNDMNQNYFFDNLNYNQRQKVWVTKVPRYGEIWWFYPRGDATECTDAVIYNVRANIWYDAGLSDGAQRSSGYFSQVFKFPVQADWDTSVETALFTSSSDTTNGSDVVSTLVNYSLRPGLLVTGTGIPADTYVLTVAPADPMTPTICDITISNDATATGTEDLTFSTPGGRCSLFQHELGVNAVVGDSVLAIESYFETSDLSWLGGGPSQPAPVGANRWLRIERIEPDFVQEGDMTVEVTGRPYAQSTDVTSNPYTFTPNTDKIDMREQRRELRLKFTSNTSGGDYQCGKIVITAEVGDERGY